MLPLLAALLALLLTGCGGGGGNGGGEAPAPRATAGVLGPDRIRYALDLEHAPASLAGSVRIAFRNPFGRPLRRVWVRAWPNAFGSCATPLMVLRPRGGVRIGERRHGCTALRLDLPEAVPAGGDGQVELTMALGVPEGADRFGRARGVDYLGNALPVLAVADDGEWRLSPYTFRGDAFFSLIADWDVSVRAEPGARVASTGSGRHGRLRARARDFALAIGPMDVAEARAGDVRVRWFAPRGSGAASDQAARVTAQLLRALERNLGPYGEPELDVVQSFGEIASGGIAMEYPGLIMSPPARGAIAHELAHQWFYAQVGNDQWREPWVDETLTSYAATRLGPELHGPDRLRGCAQRDREPELPGPVDRTMGRLERGDRADFRDTLYIEGPCVLLNLNRSSEGAVDDLLRELVRERRGGVLTSAELEARIRALPGGDEAAEDLGL